MILLLGGTSDAEKIARELEALDLTFVVSVATDYGASVTTKYTERVIQGRMDTQEMVALIKERGISLIIDGTHPFAELVSENAIAASQLSGCDYLRYERASLPLPDAVTVTNSQAACELALKTVGKIYLTVGSKTMKDYVTYLPLERIKTRVLPVVSVLEQLAELGLNADHIEGIRGPFSAELNEALLRNAQATAMITKDSGATGGLLEKNQACQQLGIPLIVITRPTVNYPQCETDLDSLSQWIRRWRDDR